MGDRPRQPALGGALRENGFSIIRGRFWLLLRILSVRRPLAKRSDRSLGREFWRALRLDTGAGPDEPADRSSRQPLYRFASRFDGCSAISLSSICRGFS